MSAKAFEILMILAASLLGAYFAFAPVLDRLAIFRTLAASMGN